MAISPASSFDAIRKKHLRQQSLWKDPDFPAKDSSIYYSKSPPEDLQWLRPYEICRQFGEEPKFLYDGGSRFDLVQGALGDCWVVASAASVADNPILFERVVPPEQNFNKDWYAGIFRFNFWRYGTWVEVCVDDRLPTQDGELMMIRSSRVNEFWGALLEKAYAKLQGSYEGLEGGYGDDALMDFTGGLVETFTLKQQPLHDLTRLIVKAFERGSIITASTTSDSANNSESLHGLIDDHVYSITRFLQVQKPNGGEKEQLVRIRNPWGTEVEWKGPWSDSSAEWRDLSTEVRIQIGLVFDADGEFWMSLKDFGRHFDTIEICNLTADSLQDPKKTWTVSVAHSRWRRNDNAGGRPELETFWKNPQFHLTVEDHDEDDDNLASVVVELLQKDRRNLRLRYLTTGFVVYEVPPGTAVPLNKDHLNMNEPVAITDAYWTRRMAVKRFSLPPGSYVIIPTTWSADEEADFMLRVFSEAACHMSNEISPSS